MLLIVKSLHIIFMVTWFGGLFYLPRLFVYHAQADDRISHRALQGDGAQALLGHHHAGRRADHRVRPVAVAGLVPGRGRWLHAKLALVAVLVAYHVWCGRLMMDFSARAQYPRPCLVPLVQRDSDAGPGRASCCSSSQAARSGALLRHRAARPGGAARRPNSPRWARRTRPQSRAASRLSAGTGKPATGPISGRASPRASCGASREFEYARRRRPRTTRRARWTGCAYFTVERTLRVNVSAQKSPLTSLDFATLRIKDAVCDRFRDAGGGRPERRPCRPGRARARLPRGRARHALPGHLGRAAVQARLARKRGRSAVAREPRRRHRPAVGLEAGRAAARSHVRRRHAAGRGGGDGARPCTGGEEQFRFREIEEFRFELVGQDKG